MKVWSIANQKGGVGKTTTTITLASILARRGGRVLLVDLDPHGSLTSYLGFDPADSSYGVYQSFCDSMVNPEDHIRKTDMSGISILKSSLMLATVDRSIGGSPGKGLIIKNVLEKLEKQYDYVLIDCPPILGVLMINALAACNFLIVPSQAEYLSLNGLERMIETLAMVNKSINQNLNYLIVPTMYDKRTRASQSSLDVMSQKYPEHIWQFYIPTDTKLREASKEGVSILDIAAGSRATLAYKRLVNDIIQRTRSVAVDLIQEAV